MGPILPEFLGELVHKTGGRGGGGRSRGGGGSATADKRKSSTTGGRREGAGALRCAPVCPFPSGQGELALYPGRTVLLNLHDAVLSNNWHLCGVCWEDCKRKHLHVPTPPEVATTVAGTLKADQG